jgi:hypothetical protein
MVSAIVFGSDIRHLKLSGFVLILSMIIIWALCINKSIRKKIFYLYFHKLHIEYMTGEQSSRYNRIVINKFENTLDLFVDVQTHVFQSGETKKFDYLDYSKFVQKMKMTKALNPEVLKKLIIYNRKDKIKSIL